MIVTANTVFQEFSIFQFIVSHSVCSPNVAEAIVVKCSWDYAYLLKHLKNISF